jgi:putative Mg2+ transporter-C (MgtC) family protein
MNILNDLFVDNTVSIGTSAVRLLLSLFAGGIIGFEREYRRQPAGFKTHILICVGSTLLMLLSIYIPQQFFDMKNGDPGRIAAQVVSGIGFLGAGAILKLGNNVKGLTTAASIWVSAGIGLAIGAGMFIPAIIALAIIMFVLLVLDNVEKKLFPPERIKTINLYFDGSSVDTKKITKLLISHGIAIQSVDVVQEIHKELVQVNLLVRIPINTNIPQLYKDIRGLSNIYKIKMNENS